jgi:deazaflavin-dependent oxidoreductase (nitroreductase family)
MNARMNRNIRRGRGRFLGMDVLIPHTAGRHSGQPRQSPVAWFADAQGAWLIVASGGRRHPDWYPNLVRTRAGVDRVARPRRRAGDATISSINDRVAASPVPPSPWATVSMGRTFPPGVAASG